MDKAAIIREIKSLNENSRAELLKSLRKEFPIHKIEREWNTTAENLLEAISSAGPLNKRAVKGMLAEATFKAIQPSKWPSLKDETPAGDLEYDFAFNDGQGPVRIQVKNQRSEKGTAKIIQVKGYNAFVAETQKTRGGKDSSGNSTRPYKVGSFDILAVCMYASTGSWEDFRFTVASWLVKNKKNPSNIATMQPIIESLDKVWTTDLNECIAWLRSGRTECVMPSVNKTAK